MDKMSKAMIIHLNIQDNERSHMKHNVLMLVLMAICSLGTHTLYAGRGDALYRAGAYLSRAHRNGMFKNGWFTKSCPDCGGSGGDWWGRCEKCDGSGKVYKWVNIIIVGAIVLMVIAGYNETRKKS